MSEMRVKKKKIFLSKMNKNTNERKKRIRDGLNFMKRKKCNFHFQFRYNLCMFCAFFVIKSSRMSRKGDDEWKRVDEEWKRWRDWLKMGF